MAIGSYQGDRQKNLHEVLEFHKFSLKWVPNVLSAEQKAARAQMSRELYNNLIFEPQKNFVTIINRNESWYYWCYAEFSMWAQSRHDVPAKPFQKIDSKKSMFTIFFSGEKRAFLDSSPKGQNIDSYYVCNNVLEGVKAGALAGTRKVTLRDFHIHMDNYKVHNSDLTKGKLDEKVQAMNFFPVSVQELAVHLEADLTPQCIRLSCLNGRPN
jgi:hypothetical protein